MPFFLLPTFRRFCYVSIGLLLAGVFACRTDKPVTADSGPVSPDVAFGDLFNAVQMARVFPDGKTFADCTPKAEPQVILAAWNARKGEAGVDLKAFVLEYFEPPVAPGSQFRSDTSRSVADHINALWPVLTRPADSVVRGTLLPLPHPYVVPGGRFGEIYYWDSYFTMLGLEAAGREDLIRNMTDNFAYLIDTYGHIPNGNRSYYLSRSQPPFFSLMAGLTGDLKHYLPQLEKEYRFWMDGADSLSAGNPAVRRVVRMSDGSILNRYWDDRAAPRPESWREDVETAREVTDRPAEAVYRDIKAAAESGWDFSSRWNVDSTLARINTTDIVPVDLNCLLFNLENAIAGAYHELGRQEQRDLWAQRALDRQRAIRHYCYDAKAGWFQDYNWRDARQTGVLSLAGMYPLFFAIAADEEAQACAGTLSRHFLRPGGLVTTANHTGQQWDAPNGWAPLQWISIAGLRQYGHTGLAATVKERWVTLCTGVYHRTGKLLEKYNVEDLSLEAGGGEYPVQDGFGWSNGVLLRLLSEN